MWAGSLKELDTRPHKRGIVLDMVADESLASIYEIKQTALPRESHN